MLKERQIKHEQLLFLFCVFVAVGLLGLNLSIHSAKENLEHSEATQLTDWTLVLYDATFENESMQNMSVREAMSDIRSLIQGGEVTWDTCSTVSTAIEIQPSLFTGNSAMSIDNVNIVEVGSELKITATWRINELLWNMWEYQRAETLWHEYFHLQQICQLAHEVFSSESNVVSTEYFQQVLQENSAKFEAEVIAVLAYWRYRNPSSNFDGLLQAPLLEGDTITLFDIWSRFFLTQESLPWNGLNTFQATTLISNPKTFLLTENGEGIPLFEEHQNWNSWVQAIDEVYIRNRLRPTTSD